MFIKLKNVLIIDKIQKEETFAQKHLLAYRKSIRIEMYRKSFPKFV